jgi:hypothetical protein
MSNVNQTIVDAGFWRVDVYFGLLLYAGIAKVSAH